VLILLFGFNFAFGQNVGDIIITEIMQNPDTVTDANGEWFEVYNTTAVDIDMNGWTIKDDGSNSHVISSSIIVLANSYAVLGRNGNTAQNGGVDVDYVYSSFQLANNQDEIILLDGATEIDAVKYKNSLDFPLSSGKSMTLRDTKFTDTLNDIGFSWCEATSIYNDNGGNLDLGTPGTANDDCGCNNLEEVVWVGGMWTPHTPNFETNTVFRTNYNTNLDGGSVETCNCTINAGKRIIITGNKYLKAINNIINNGRITVRNRGSIVQENDDATTTGLDYRIRRTTPTYVDYDYTYWSSPTQNETIGNVFATNPSNYIFEFITANFSDADGDTFDDDNDDWNHITASKVMTPGVGYIAMGEGSPFPLNNPIDTGTQTQTVTFNGTINNGVINVPVTLDKFNTDNGSGNSFNTNTNLIGNPYPSAIDIKKLFSENPSVLEGTFYFWTHDSSISDGNPGPDAYNFTNNDYATATTDGIIFNQVNGGSAGTSAPEFIASGQGFFANVDVAGTLTLNNSMRVTGNNNNFKNIVDSNVDRVWFNLTNLDGLYRQILIAFSKVASDDFTKGQDGQRIESGNNSDFYSKISNNESNFAIQTLSLIDDEKTIQLGVKVIETGLFTINIDHFENDIEYTDIYLKDNLLNITTNLKLQDYTFEVTQEGVFENRFEILFVKNSLSVNDDIIAAKNLIISNQNETIYFKMRNGENINKISGFDVLGRLVLQANPNSNNFNISTNINSGTILFFKVKLENGQTLTKKFIKL
jgi:hypothetical protein